MAGFGKNLGSIPGLANKKKVDRYEKRDII
jgi:hypothetical protein